MPALRILAASLLLASTAFAADKAPVKVLIVTGDNVGGHNWRATTPVLEKFLKDGGRFQVDVTATPGRDLTKDNLAKYDVLLLNYKDTPQGEPDSKWSDANKEAFLQAVRDGKGLVVYHFASAAFARPNWEEFEKAIAGGWRTQGFHGPPHEFSVKKTDVAHPVSKGLPAKFDHVKDELYSNSLLTPGSVVLATAFCDPSKPRGTGKDEAVIWVNQYGKGRVFNCALGHDAPALSDPQVIAWMKRGTEWAGSGTVAD